ncbi:unnamed protein product [Mytilus coruscus]|uniref:C2H2-type domain-containing protein n=1 Tax=Mytilus coruscus TaxID=42192 RepID=A0A6J8DEL0_MYTCO|nr:unnamed protein product [Mytilus coruscus]
MFSTNLNKVLRSILIAGDSNLKQLVPMFEYPVRTLCIPGAKVQNDRKEFYSQLMSAMKTENPDQIVLHLGSNDVFGDVESTLRMLNIRIPLEPLLRGRDCLQLGQEDQIIKEYSIKRNEIVLDVTEDLAVILSSSVIHSFYQPDTKKQSVESLQVKLSKKTAVTKKEKKSTYNCPVCPVTCSREDFLIDHVICRHAKKGKTHLVKDLSLQVPITEEPVEELRSSYDENDKHIAYGSVYIESYEVDCIIPSRTEFAESDEVECSIPTTIEFAESDELECSISTIEFAESDEVDCSIPTTIYFAESEEVESSSPTRIEFALTTVKVLASRCWKNFKRFILHLCGDVEENPGPTMEQFTFQSIEEWGRALPSGQFSENCTDLHLCPPHLKIKLGLPLLDEEFSMP